MVFSREFTDFQTAKNLEKQIKGWSRKKKQALIENRIDDLKKYSKNYTDFGKPIDGTDEQVK